MKLGEDDDGDMKHGEDGDVKRGEDGDVKLGENDESDVKLGEDDDGDMKRGEDGDQKCNEDGDVKICENRFQELNATDVTIGSNFQTNKQLQASYTITSEQTHTERLPNVKQAITKHFDQLKAKEQSHTTSRLPLKLVRNSNHKKTLIHLGTKSTSKHILGKESKTKQSSTAIQHIIPSSNRSSKLFVQLQNISKHLSPNLQHWQNVLTVRNRMHMLVAYQHTSKRVTAKCNREVFHVADVITGRYPFKLWLYVPP